MTITAGKYLPLDYKALQAMDAETEAMFLGGPEDK